MKPSFARPEKKETDVGRNVKTVTVSSSVPPPFSSLEAAKETVNGPKVAKFLDR